MKPASSKFRCVIFDLGGVVFPSPIGRLQTLERQNGIPFNALNKYIAHATTWKEVEKGIITPFEFINGRYDEELKSNAHMMDSNIYSSLLKVSGRDIMSSIMSPDAWTPRPAYVEAVRTLRNNGLKVIGLTNNFKSDPSGEVSVFDDAAAAVQNMFDLVIESSKVNLRKPSLEIYQYTCEKANVEPHSCIFLDDIGPNLKPAKDMGMQTIRVGVEDEQCVQALLTLESIVNISPLFSSNRP